MEPRPPVVTHVCDDIACMCRGANELVAELERTVGPAGQTSEDGWSTWLESPCLGLCERAPAVLVTAGGRGPGRAVDRAGERRRRGRRAGRDAAGHDGARPAPAARRSDGVRLLRRVGIVDPASLDGYRAHGGYEALRRAFELGPAGVIREVHRVQAARPRRRRVPDRAQVGRRRPQPIRPHYLVCNADESEPGTFKDRVV